MYSHISIVKSVMTDCPYSTPALIDEWRWPTWDILVLGANYNTCPDIINGRRTSRLARQNRNVGVRAIGNCTPNFHLPGSFSFPPISKQQAQRRSSPPLLCRD